MKEIVRKVGGVLLAALTVCFLPRLHGNDLSENVFTPSPSAGLTKIALGEYHIFFIVGGKIRALGSNRAGEAGFGDDLKGLPIPAKAIQAPDEVRFIDAACGGYQSIGLDEAGNVWAWGFNHHGEFGNGMTDNIWHLPTKIETDALGKPFDNVAGLAAGFHFNAALKKDGAVWIWGLSGDDHSGTNSVGLLGNGDKSTRNVTRPTQVPFSAGVVIAKISAGTRLMLALDTTGGVWVWGGGETYDRGGERGDGSVPMQITKLPPIKEIVAGDSCDYVLDTDGNLWGWGREGTYLGFGNGQDDFPITAIPVKLNFPGLNGRIKAVGTSQLTTHVIRDDGTLWGWGSSAMGEVGNGRINDWANLKPPYAWDWSKHECLVLKPVQVLDHVAAFYSSPQAPYVYAVKTDGTIWSWGRNKTGVLGNGVFPDADTASIQPNRWDVAKPTRVTPL
jgi:alpha-tubulin suppressor-like RCC1 family protein